jgi:hypothetical protein
MNFSLDKEPDGILYFDMESEDYCYVSFVCKRGDLPPESVSWAIRVNVLRSLTSMGIDSIYIFDIVNNNLYSYSIDDYWCSNIDENHDGYKYKVPEKGYGTVYKDCFDDGIKKNKNIKIPLAEIL